MAKINRQLIEEGCSVIETVATRDLSYMKSQHPDAINDRGFLLDDSYLQSRARELLQLFSCFC